MAASDHKGTVLFDVRQAAAAFGISVQQLKAAIASGRLPPPDGGATGNYALSGYSDIWMAQARKALSEAKLGKRPRTESKSRTFFSIDPKRRPIPPFDPDEQDATVDRNEGAREIAALAASFIEG